MWLMIIIQLIGQYYWIKCNTWSIFSTMHDGFRPQQGWQVSLSRTAVWKWQIMTCGRTSLLVTAELHRSRDGAHLTQRLQHQRASSCDHDHWQIHGSLFIFSKHEILRFLFGGHKDLRPRGDGCVHHSLWNPASSFCFKAEEQQWPRLKKQVVLFAYKV